MVIIISSFMFVTPKNTVNTVVHNLHCVPDNKKKKMKNVIRVKSARLVRTLIF